MTTKFRCPKCNGSGNFILNIETNEISCKNCGVVFNELTTKEKLEQLGWVIRHYFNVIEFSYQRSEGEEIDFINYYKSFKEWDFIRVKVYGITHNELQLILDYIKEIEKWVHTY